MANSLVPIIEDDANGVRQRAAVAVTVFALYQYLHQLERVFCAPRRQGRRRRISGEREGSKPGRWKRAFEQEFHLLGRLEGTRAVPQVVETRRVSSAGVLDTTVFVNPNWMDKITKASDSRPHPGLQELVRGIAAHEWSHYVRRDSESPGSRHEEELEADRTAGAHLARTGSSTLPLKRLLAREPAAASRTHPGCRERIAAVREGENKTPNAQARATHVGRVRSQT